MRATNQRPALLLIMLMLAGVLAGSPAGAVENGLLGVRIGASYRELAERFGPPDGILFPSGSGLIFQTVAPSAPQEGLPQFATPVTTETPVWVFPVRTTALNQTQSQWLYDFRNTRGVALGIVLNGEGADAVVTDVVVAGFPKYLKGKPEPLRTEKGITLQSTFTDVLKKYGYPPLIEIYAPAGAAAGARPAAGARAAAGAGRGAMRAGARGGRGAMRAGGRAGGRGGRGGPRGPRGGRAQAPGQGTATVTANDAPIQLILTAAPGGRGMRGGRGGERGGRAGRRGAGGARAGGRAAGRGVGRAVLPPLGAAGPAAAAADELTASAVVDHQGISFSRDCIMTYEGISFTLHDMKVFRIHVSE